MEKTEVIIVLSLLFIIAITSSFAVVNGFGEMVGEKTKINDVKTNKEVQELGRFAVNEYNKNHSFRSNGETKLVFSQVVEAKKQVVSGITYQLKIETTQNALTKKYDAAVLEKPWAPSKELITFTPSIE